MTYTTQYTLAVLNAAVGAVALVLAGSGLTFHPSWLNNELAATCGVIATVCGVLSQFLPPLQRTPGHREARYIAAMAGDLPKDVADKAALTVTQEPTGLRISSREQPPG